MRILQVGKYPRIFHGGVEIAIFGLSEYLSQYAEVQVVVSNINNRRGEVFYNKIKVDILPRKAVLFSAPISPELINYLKLNSNFDIIQISLPNPMANLAYLLARPKAKLVVWYHSDIVGRGIINIIYRPLLYNILKEAAYIVATSDNYLTSSLVLQKFSHKVIVIPYGVDLTNFDNDECINASLVIRERFDSPLILFIGRLVYYKGLHYLIEAMKEIDAKLVIIGEGPLESKLRLQVGNSKLTHKVFFHKEGPHESIAKYIYACDIFVLPSMYRSEAFGIVLLEAMACRKPVVTTELGTGTSFACQNEITGLVVPPKDPKTLAIAIKKILNNPDLARRMGEAGRKRVEENFTLEKMTEAFLRLYGKVLKE